MNPIVTDFALPVNPKLSHDFQMEFRVPPWKHQLKAITEAAPLTSYGLFFEVGSGKTMTLINIVREKFTAERRFLRTIILAPPIVLKNWKDEWLVHSKIPPEKIVLLTGSQDDRLKKFLANAYDSGGFPTGCIFVTNYEALSMTGLYKAFEKWKPECLVADESHKIKDFKAKRTKLACALACEQYKGKVLVREAPKYRYILTGSPILNTPMDIFTQFWFLDGGRTFGRNFFAFRGSYFRDHNGGMPKDSYYPDWRPIPERLDEMNAKIYTQAMRVLKKDCMDLPPLIKTTVKVGMTPAQGKMYAQMKKEFITFFEREGREPSPVTAQLAITKALRLMQITSGFVKDVNEEEISIEDTPKILALEEILRENTPAHKVIIWAVWKENYGQIKRLCERLGLRYVEITGDTPASKRFELVDEFNNDPGCSVFISHPSAGGIGINLISKCDVPSDIAVFFSRNFSLENSIQAEARNYRGGSEKFASVTHYDLVCEDTIDEKITEKLSQKIQVSDRVLRDLAKEL